MMRAPISGFIDFRESPEAAARRELKEELGLEPISLEMLDAYGFPSENQVVIAYHCRASGEVLLSEELDDYQLIPVEKLRAWDFWDRSGGRRFPQAALRKQCEARGIGNGSGACQSLLHKIAF
jgi:ADP-ribose pyrophosphatase YjhB (NUDIX family)